MKKTLLAAALAVGFAGAAQAQTSVTLYGIIDGGIGYTETKIKGGAKSSTVGLVSGVQSGSRWGLKGVEDLGGGLKAVFVLESGFDIATGQAQQGFTSNNNTTNRQFGRRATLGLASDSWGQLEIGRQTNLSSNYFAAIDPFGTGFSFAGAQSSFRSAGTIRYDNLALYQTPNFSGFQFGVGYSFNTDGSQKAKVKGQSETNNRGITVGLRYNSGPLQAALTYDQVKTGYTAAVAAAPAVVNWSTGVVSARPAAAASNGGTVKAWNLGLAYDFEVVKVHAGFGQERDGVIASSSTHIKGADWNNYLLGLSAPLGGGNFLVSYQLNDPRGDIRSAKKQHVYSAGYTYGLSKRTNVYLAASHAKNWANVDGSKRTLFAVGLRHQF